jgi:hypothetical protein
LGSVHFFWLAVFAFQENKILEINILCGFFKFTGQCFINWSWFIGEGSVCLKKGCSSILNNISPKTKDLLREVIFHTPYDDLSVNSKNVELGKAQEHPILSGFYNIRLFEKRTKGLNTEAAVAIEEVLHAAHKHKKRVLMQPGDFVGISNNLSLHGKEIYHIASEEESRKRYSIKTVNVHNPSIHMKYFVKGTDYLVKG